MGYKDWTCSKCGSKSYEIKELMMLGKETIKNAYWFNVFICKKCGYSEKYFKDQGYSII
jgi:predicted nucleic-acid-binding Zn-ribbon protein